MGIWFFEGIFSMHRDQSVSYLSSEHFRSEKNLKLKSSLTLFFTDKETEETKVQHTSS